MRMLRSFALTYILILLLDYLWLGFIAKGFFQHHLASMLREEVYLLPALGFYTVFALGVAYFAVETGYAAGRWQIAAFNGAFFGFACYCSFDFTCYAVFTDFPAAIIPLDIAWGAFIGGFPAALTVYCMPRPTIKGVL
jgi:uncharacterized membrane protein